MLPPTARDEAATILGRGSVATMLRRALALRDAALATDAPDATDASDAMAADRASSDAHTEALSQAAAAIGSAEDESTQAQQILDDSQRSASGPGLVEVLLDDGRPTVLRRADGTETPLATYVPSSSVLYALAALAAHDAAAPAAAAATPLPLLRDGRSVAAAIASDSPAAAAAAATVALDDSDTAEIRAAGDGTVQMSATSMRDASAAAEEAACFAQALKKRPIAFSSDGRAGISGTLHRISAMRDMTGSVVGLTLRVGRHKQGAAQPLLDLLTEVVARDKYSATGRRGRGVSDLYDPQSRNQQQNHDGEDENELSPSMLLIGGPGSGKTTMLRDTAQQLSTTFGLGRRVVVVDSTNEIGGYGRVRPRLCWSTFQLSLS